MSWRTFWQIALLILLYWSINWFWTYVRERQVEASYNARMEQIRSDQENSLRELRESSHY